MYARNRFNKLLTVIILTLLTVSPVFANLTVDSNYTLVSSKRVSRTDTEYTYSANLTNTGSDATNVTATVTSTSANTIIVDGDLSFGDVTSGTTVTSSDTFTLRQNRRFAFDPNALIFDIKATFPNGLPPDPGADGKLTLEGTDTDNDGVRDDIQRHIALTYPNSERTRTALTNIAITLQQTLLDADGKALSLVHANNLVKASECIAFIDPSNGLDAQSVLEGELFNTAIRSFAYVTFNEQLGGEIFPVTPMHQWKSSCTFDPDTLGN